MFSVFKVSPIPVKRRVRFTKSGHAYTDIKTEDDLRRVRVAYNGKYYETEPLVLTIDIFKPLPKGKKTHQPFTIKPDIDNVIKAVMDGLKGKAYKDDAQIVEVMARKHDRVCGIDERVTFRLKVDNERE